MQPGINPENVIVGVHPARSDCDESISSRSDTQVVVDEKFSEALSLIELFHFRGEKASSSASYMGEQ